MYKELELLQDLWEGILKRKSITLREEDTDQHVGRTGHVEQRPMHGGLRCQDGELSFPMKEDLEGREVAGVSSTSPVMTTSVPNVSQGGTPLQKQFVKEHFGDYLEPDAQPFGQNTWVQSSQPTVPDITIYPILRQVPKCL